MGFFRFQLQFNNFSEWKVPGTSADRTLVVLIDRAKSWLLRCNCFIIFQSWLWLPKIVEDSKIVSGNSYKTRDWWNFQPQKLSKSYSWRKTNARGERIFSFYIKMWIGQKMIWKANWTLYEIFMFQLQFSCLLTCQLEIAHITT